MLIGGSECASVGRRDVGEAGLPLVLALTVLVEHQLVGDGFSSQVTVIVIALGSLRGIYHHTLSGAHLVGKRHGHVL